MMSPSIVVAAPWFMGKVLILSIKTEVPFIYPQFFNNVLYAIMVIFDENILITTHL